MPISLHKVQWKLCVIEEITGEKEANCIGYCIGGTLLAATQAYYVAKRLKNHVKSATCMATIIDFENPGSLGVFINEPVVSGLENLNNQLGYFDGRQLAVTFSLLRENTLYWNYYIDNYLKVKNLLILIFYIGTAMVRISLPKFIISYCAICI